MNDTPRTDKEEDEPSSFSPDSLVVPSGLAAELETELNEASRKLSEIQKLSRQFPGILASKIQAILNS